MKYFFIATLLLVACSSKPRPVNEEFKSPIWPGTTDSTEASHARVDEALGRAPITAVSGRVIVKGDIPTPLSRSPMGLYRLNGALWTEVAQLSTETDGSFKITQKLTSGTYEIRLLSSKLQGRLGFTLEDRPLHHLIVEAELKQ